MHLISGPSLRCLRHSIQAKAHSPQFATPSLQVFSFCRRKYACNKSNLTVVNGSRATVSPPITTSQFWSSRATWRRAAVNTLRCLVGCTTGDFGAMWYLQSFYPGLGVGTIMGISMVSGISTSILLETTLLRFGRDRLQWLTAARTAVGMSMISIVTMEVAENLVDLHLTGGVIQLDSPAFWGAAVVAMGAGFLAPLPYNYVRLRRYGKACH